MYDKKEYLLGLRSAINYIFTYFSYEYKFKCVWQFGK